MTLKQVTNKQELLDEIKSERKKFMDVLAQVNNEQMDIAGVQGDWSVKDILAHVAFWEESCAHWLFELNRGRTPAMPAEGMTWDDIDRLNDQKAAEFKNMSVDQAVADFYYAHNHLLYILETLTEEELFAERHNWYPDEFGKTLWGLTAANTFWHYQEHYDAIAEWLNRVRQK